MEVWKDIYFNDVDYRGYYQISNYGNVRSLDRFSDGRNGRRF